MALDRAQTRAQIIDLFCIAANVGNILVKLVETAMNVRKFALNVGQSFFDARQSLFDISEALLDAAEPLGRFGAEIVKVLPEIMDGIEDET